MKHFFPIELAVQFSRKNKVATYGIFLGCSIIATIKGYIWGGKYDSSIWRTFFDHWSESSLKMLIDFIEILSSPIGLMARGLTTFLIFLWLVYIFTGLKKRIEFDNFALPFMSLATLGLLLHFLGLLLKLFNLIFPLTFLIPIILYILIFYCLLLKKEFGVEYIRGSRAVIGSFLILFLFSGYFTIAPYLSWI